MIKRIAKVKNAVSGSPVGWAELDEHGIPSGLYDEQGEAILWPSEGVSVDGATSNETVEIDPQRDPKPLQKKRRRDAILRYLSRPADDPSDTERFRVKIENAIELLRDLADRIRDIERRIRIERGATVLEVSTGISTEAEII